MTRWLQRQWYRWSLWQLLLLPLSWIFGLLALLRRRWYAAPRHRVVLPVPVIVVGNISVGGTGKTPLVIALAQALVAQGYRPGIVSRGYAGAATVPQAVTQDSLAQLVGDEPLLLARKTQCPVWIGKNRVAAAQALLAQQAQVNVILSDDGLQHYRLARAIEIVVVDATLWFGNGQLLPAGPLREPVSRLKKADAVVINGWLPGAPVQRREFTMQLTGDLLYNLRNPAMRAQPEIFAGQTLHAIAGIGNPQRFFEQLSKLGLRFHAHPFPDHHRYTPSDFTWPESEPLIMTEKDAVKCEDFVGDNAWVLAITAQLDAGLEQMLLQKLRSSHGR